MTKFHDLSFTQRADGTVLLTQTDCGEDYSIAAHPEQLLFIARRLCGMKADTAEKVADLERKLAILCDRLGEFISDPNIRNDIIDRCRDGIEYIVRLDGLHDLAIEFDGNRLLPCEPPPPNVISERFKHMPPPKTGEQLGLAV